jgi:hypothetical protein
VNCKILRYLALAGIISTYETDSADKACGENDGCSW